MVFKDMEVPKGNLSSIVGLLQLMSLIEDIKIVCFRKAKYRDLCKIVFLLHLVSPICQINDFQTQRTRHVFKRTQRSCADIASCISKIILGNKLASFTQRASEKCRPKSLLACVFL